MAVESIGTLVPTKIPGYADTADIQAALRAYHYGSYTFNTAETDKANLLNPSMAYTISSLQDSVAEIVPGIAPSTLTGKGSLITASSGGTATNLSVGGSNGLVLTVNSSATNGIEWATPEVTQTNSVTLSNKTISSPTLTLSTTTSTTEGRIAWDSTLDKIIVGDGTTAREFASSTLKTSTPTFSTNVATLALSDKDCLVELTNGSTAGTINVPTNVSVAFPIGTVINLIQTGSGQITVGGAGVTINGTPGLKIRTQWSSASLVKRGTDTWILVGDLSA
jgi:hypothetical protein